MKKILAIAVLALGISIAAAAQPRAIGARFTYGVEASYQHEVGGADFVEATLGLFTYNRMNIAATYNFMIAQPAWTARGEWGFYAGPGAAISTSFDDFAFAIAGQIGLEYTFWFPLQLSIDLRPQIGVWAGHHHAEFYNGGLYGFCPSLSVRYRF